MTRNDDNDNASGGFMFWPFSHSPTKAELQGRRVVKVGEFAFMIRRISPLIDFPEGNIPPILNPLLFRGKKGPVTKDSFVRGGVDDMISVIEAGVIEPKLVPVNRKDRGNEDGITAEDLIRWGDVGSTLYAEIIAWSMIRHRGIRGCIQMMIDRLVRRHGQGSNNLTIPQASELERQMFDTLIAAEIFKKESSGGPNHG